MQSVLRLALCLALAVSLYSSAASAAFLYTELTSTDTQQCAQASVVFVHMYECGFCFSTGASSSYKWLCNMTNAEKFEWASSSTCTGQPDSSTSKNLYVCASGVMPSVYEGTSDAIMNGILNLAFAPGKLFTVASYFHSSESTVCANGQNAPELVATSATFCSATSTVTLCNSTHVEELACAPGCGAGTCTTTSSTALPCAASTSGTVKLECRIDVLSPPQGIQPPLGGGGNPFPDFPPGFNPPPFDGTFPPGFNPPPFDGTFPPGFNPPPFDGTFPPGFNPPPFDGTASPPTARAPTTQTAPTAATVSVRLRLVIVANVTTLPVSNTCPFIRELMSSLLGVDSGLTACTAVALTKRAGTAVAVDIIFSGSAATVANTALLGADKNATTTALSARLLQIPGVESVSSVQAEQVNPPTTSSAPVKPAAPSNSKASPASSFSFSSIVILSLVSLILGFTW